ncbi:MAG: hypothetical protein ACRC0S_04370 [Fusobacteriaceae bacterium]
MKITLCEKKQYGKDVLKFKFSSEEFEKVNVHGCAAILSTNGKDKRAYSISLKTNENELVFFIKKVGLVSSQLHDLEIGAIINCDLIYSHTFGRNIHQEEICCIGGGVGVAPLVNLMSFNNNPSSVLVSSFKYEDEVFLVDKDINFKISKTDTYVTREYSPIYANGRITKAALPLGFKAYYICGSLEFCRQIERDLVSNKINPYNIFIEAW